MVQIPLDDEDALTTPRQLPVLYDDVVQCMVPWKRPALGAVEEFISQARYDVQLVAALQELGAAVRPLISTPTPTQPLTPTRTPPHLRLTQRHATAAGGRRYGPRWSGCAARLSVFNDAIELWSRGARGRR